MIRKVVEIDQDKCNGCGLCAEACHEGAIQMIDGKARLVKDDYCDGLGDCLPACPTDAIQIVEREAAAYDESAVKQHLAKRAATGEVPPAGGCPGSRMRMLHRETVRPAAAAPAAAAAPSSELVNWPVQIKLAPVQAPYFAGARLLIAADCTAYAYANFHQEFLRGHVALIGCPKLDMVDYAEKLTEIIRQNDIKSVRVVRMEVPCCGGIENAVKRALQDSGKMIPWQVITVAIDGHIVEN